MNLNYHFALADRAGIDRNVLKLAIDLANGQVTQYSIDQGNEAFRQEMIKIFGSEKPNWYQFQQNKYKFYEIVSIAVDSVVTQGIEDTFGNWVDIHNMNMGDSPVFEVSNPDLFNVSAVSDGNANIRRQRIVNKKVTVTTAPEEITLYEELMRFLAGRVDWAKLVAKAAASFDAKIAATIYAKIYAAYDALSATYGITGAFDETKLSTLCAHTEAANRNAQTVIMGTKLALANITSAVISEAQKTLRNEYGYYGKFNGWDIMEIKQSHKPSTDTFAIDDAFLLVVPIPEDKMVKLVLEGNTIVIDKMNNENADMSIEHTLIKKYGAVVVASQKYGMYKISG
jgi:hypothetical protein